MKLLLISFFLFPLLLFGQTEELDKKFTSAETHIKKGKYKKAIKVYSKIIAKDEHNGLAYFKRAMLKNKIGRDFCSDLKLACKYEGVEQKSACENHELYCQ